MFKKMVFGACVLALGVAFAMEANAVEFKLKGQWVVNFEYGQHGMFTQGGKAIGWSKRYVDDDFEPSQRVRLQLDAVASETLSGSVYFEIGQQKWGRNSQGAAIGADGTVVELKGAWLDFIPFDDFKVRMGIQNVTLPSFTTTSQIMAADVAAVTFNWSLNDYVGLTGYWIRPWNDNFSGYPDSYQSGYMDNVDYMGLAVPLTFDGVKMTPWALYGILGPNAFRSGNDYFSSAKTSYYSGSLFPVLYGNMTNGKMTGWGNAWWAGFTGEVTAFAPWRFAWDFNYGSFRHDHEMYNRQGWLASALVEYALDFGIPGIHGWYSSGDDDDASNGSERLPYTGLDETGANSFDKFAFGGGRPNTFRDSRIAHSMAGTWGVGLHLKNFSFIDNVKHTFTANYIGGTNSPKLMKELHEITGEWMTPNNFDCNYVGMEKLYMTTHDGALSFTLLNDWKVYDNFTISFDASYIHLMLDQSSTVWGQSKMNGKSDNVADAWNLSATFLYSF